MTTLHDKISALPEWPVWKGASETWTFPDNFAETDPTCYAIMALGAAQARLALAREFMEMVIADGADAEDGADCSCPWCSNARALLKALEGPK